VNELNFGTMAITGGTTSLGSLVFNASDGNESGAAIAGVTGGGGTLIMSGGTLYIGTGNSTDASNVSTTLGGSGIGIINLNTGGAQTGATVTLTGGTIGATSAWSSSLNMTLANTVTFQSENLIATANTPSGTAETIALSGALTNGTSAGTLAATGNGALVLSGPNTYSGGTTITGGTVSFAQADSLPATGAVSVGAAGTLVANAGGTGEFTSGTGAGTIGGLITGPSYTAGAILAINTSDSNGSYSVSTSAAVPSTVILQELGTGTVSLTGHIDAPSILIASGGTVNLSGGSAATDFLNSSPQSPDGAGTLNITGGTYNSTSPNLNFGTGGVDMTGGAWTFSGAFAIGRGTNANGLFTLAGGTISDSGGQLTVGRTTGVGIFTITSGTFTDSIPTTNQSIAVFIGRDVDTGSAMTVNGGSATVTDILDLAANNGTTGITNGTLTIAGGVASIGSIAFNGSDTNAASGGVAHAISASTATDSGILNVTGGTLYIGNPTDAANIAITSGSVGIVNLYSGSTGATINLSGGTVGANSNWSSSLNMGLSNSNGGVTFQTANAVGAAENISLSGALSGTGGFTETGGGTLTLSGNSTYSGATTVSAGTLVVSGSLNGTASLSVNSGTAEMESRNDINSAAHLSLAAGTLETLASQTETLGDLTLGAGISKLTLGATGSILNFADSSGDTWTGTLSISGWNGASAGGGSDRIFIGSTEDLTSQQLADITFINGSLNGNSFTSDGAAQLPDGELVAAVVPEPGAWGMLLGGLATLAGLQRSYRRRISRSSM
jgi:autotransporter-associated beta strand protein